MEVVRIFIQIGFTCLFPLRKEVGIVFVRVVRLGFIYCLWTLGLILCDSEYKLQFACQPDMDTCMYKRLESSLEYSSYSSWQTCFYKLTNIPWRTESGHQVWSVWVWSPCEAICWCEHKCWPRNSRRATAGDGWASLPPASPHPWGSLYFTRPKFLELVSSLTQTHPGIFNAIFWCSCLNSQDVSSEASCSRKKWDVFYLMPHAFSEGMFGLPVYQHADKMEVFWETLADPVPKSRVIALVSELSQIVTLPVLSPVVFACDFLISSSFLLYLILLCFLPTANALYTYYESQDRMLVR